ncbi:MAG: hypothetical protein ACT4QG_20405 [Sporichthyaceae bacterium]
MTDETRAPNTYRVSDGTAVWFNTALDAWIPLAYDELLAVASTYRKVIVHEDLAEHVQELSGIATRVEVGTWIPKLLEGVAILAKAQGDPPLTALCVRANGTVAPGYAKLPKSVPDDAGDAEANAAKHRWLCYQRYAKDLPEDGGRPGPAFAKQRVARASSSGSVTPRTTTPRAPRSSSAKPAVVAPEPVRAPICPVHFQVLPPSGRCDLCDY